MSERRIPKWLVMSNGGATCKRCGKTEKPTLPMPIGAFTHWARYVGELHRYCVEKEAARAR